MKVKADHIYLFRNHPGGRLFTEWDVRLGVTRQVPNVVDRGRGMLPPPLNLIRGKRGKEVGPRIAIRPEWSAGRRECLRKLLYPIS